MEQTYRSTNNTAFLEAMWPYLLLSYRALYCTVLYCTVLYYTIVLYYTVVLYYAYLLRICMYIHTGQDQRAYVHTHIGQRLSWRESIHYLLSVLCIHSLQLSLCLSLCLSLSRFCLSLRYTCMLRSRYIVKAIGWQLARAEEFGIPVHLQSTSVLDLLNAPLYLATHLAVI